MAKETIENRIICKECNLHFRAYLLAEKLGDELISLKCPECSSLIHMKHIAWCNMEKGPLRRPSHCTD